MNFMLPFVIGALGVLQNTINKKFAANPGIPIALLVNSLVMIVLSVGFYFVMRQFPRNFPLYQPVENTPSVGLWLLVPGLMGFFIIAACPFALERAGATRVFIAVIAAQIVVSLLWDRYMDAQTIEPQRLAGAALALAGALLAAR